MIKLLISLSQDSFNRKIMRTCLIPKPGMEGTRMPVNSPVLRGLGAGNSPWLPDAHLLSDFIFKWKYINEFKEIRLR